MPKKMHHVFVHPIWVEYCYFFTQMQDMMPLSPCYVKLSAKSAVEESKKYMLKAKNKAVIVLKIISQKQCFKRKNNKMDHSFFSKSFQNAFRIFLVMFVIYTLLFMLYEQWS